MRLIYILAIISGMAIGCGRPSTPEENAPPVSKTAATDEVTPREKGIAAAKRDIAEGNMRILGYGLPPPEGTEVVQEATGLPVEFVEGCAVTHERIAEIGGYNDTMTVEALRKTANKAMEGTSL